MKPARAVTSRAGDVYGAHRALPFGREGGKAKHNMRHGMLKFSPDWIMLTLAQIWGRDSKEFEGENLRLIRPAAASVEEGSPRQRARRTTRKKSPISRMKRRGRERQGGRREKFPFCLSSFAAFTPPRPPRPLPQSFSLARGPLSSFSSLSSPSPCLPPSSLSRRRKTVQVTLSLLLHPTCEKWPKIRV